jgi:AraC-like DNA-binding protein
MGNQEVVAFQRRAELAGVEIRTVQNSTQSFRCYCPEFEFLTPIAWRGEIWHGRQQALLEPGSLLCAHPGEVFLGRRVLTPGTLRSLSIEGRALDDYLAEHGLSSDSLRFRPFARMSKRLESRLFCVFDQIRPGPTPLELQADMVELVASMAAELVETSKRPLVASGVERLAAERVRECLRHDLSGRVDLSSVARQVGMSRFRALRVFKAWYGLPPHRYQLSVRLGLAQKSLRDGQDPAAVAVEYGFVDQSHLTKHFRRLLGVTPAKYARIGTERALRCASSPA